MEPINQLLEQGLLKNLLQKSQELVALNKLVQNALVEHLKPYCEVANYHAEEGELVLAITSGAFATELRFQLPQLTKTLQQYPILKNLKQIRCYIK